jgi:hypothetical protein
MTYQPCRSCARHVRREDSTCPFCEAPMPAPPAPTTPAVTAGGSSPQGRASRIAVLAAGAALLGAAASCDDGRRAPDAGLGGQTMIGSGGAGGGGVGGAGGSPDPGAGGASPDAGTDAPIAIYAAAVALVRRNQG